MRALVTGGTGFVGNVLAKALRDAGWEVHAIMRPGSAASRTDQLSAAGCVLHRHDGSLQGMREIIATAQPACTWHLATLFIADHAPDDVIPLVRANVEFGALLLEALSTRPQAPLVTAGSAWQQHDNASYSPISLYAATKQAFDSLAVYFAEVRRMRIVECLLTDTYGTVDPRKKLLWALANAVRTGTPLPMSGEGRQLIDLLHVDDAVRALLIAGERARAGVPGLQERWAVRPGQPITVRELVERYAHARGVSVPVEWGARPPRPRERLVPWSAGEVLPGWTPRIALDAGLAGLA
jgi:nucleoside-diphosphate-sugar epimerase